MRYIQRGVDLANPVDFAHPLNVGLRAWYLSLPGLMGGAKWHDIMSAADLAVGNHGTLTNMVQGATSGWQPMSQGRGFGSVLFDGSNDAVKILDTASQHLNSLTLSLWMKTTDTTQINRYLLSKLTNSLTDNVWAILYGYANFGLGGAATHVQLYLTGAAYGFGAGGGNSVMIVADKNWHHICYTFDRAGQWAGYLDGAQQNSVIAGYVGIGATTAPLYLGSFDSTANFYAGYLDDIRIYGRALGAAEVRSLYLESSQGYPRALQWIGTKRYPLSSLIVPQKYTYVEEEGD